MCANHLAQFGIGRYPARSPRPSSRSPASTCSRPANSWAARAPRRSCCRDPFGGVYKKLVHQGRQAGRRLPVRRHGRRRWYFKLLREGRSIARHPRQADVRRVEPRRHRPRGPQQGRRDGRRRRGLRLQRRVARARSARRSRSKGLFTLDEVRKHTKASALLRLVHRPGRADPDVHRRRRLLRARRRRRPMCGCTDAQPPGSARRDPRAASC